MNTTTIQRIPEKIPACVINMLSRSEWYADVRILQRARLAPAHALARLLSSHVFAGRSDIAAITFGHTIYFRRPECFDPHSAAGLALLGHELKHVEQFERHAAFGFYTRYLWEYSKHGYSEVLSHEAEAYQLGRLIHLHISSEFLANPYQPCCLPGYASHAINPAYIKQQPPLFTYIHGTEQHR